MDIQSLRALIPQAMLRDQWHFRRQLAVPPVAPTLVRQIQASVALRTHREQSRPRPTFPPELPVSEKRDEIARAIMQNQAVVICGETGSGKTTQLPKICLELGRGIAGMIGHTQPRRIAARSVCARIAQELHTRVGQHVAYKIRFSDNVSDNTNIKLMTDGILLAETQNEGGGRYLNQYDTLILDEAHERSLNIDFLLGYLKQLLPKRPDLKLIITSATIDPASFSKHFNDAPIVMVSGRTYPVEIRYLAPQSPPQSPPSATARQPDDDDDPIQSLLTATDELTAAGPGDILIFLPGERDIRSAAELLEGKLKNSAISHQPSAIIPLMASLP